MLMLIRTPLTQRIEHNYLDIEEIKLIVIKEIEAMRNDDQFFTTFNDFYMLCQNKMPAMLDTYNIDNEDTDFYCKLLENTIPEYFMPVFVIDSSKNEKIVEDLIREFFKIYREMDFDIERIRIAKIFEKDISMLYRLRGLFSFEQGYFSSIMSRYLPDDSSKVNEAELTQACHKFINLLIFKFMEKSNKLFYANPQLYMFTWYKLFENPFEMFTFFLNDLAYMENIFMQDYMERRLYLIDNLDNLALKSLNIFKSKKTKEIFNAMAKRSKNMIEGAMKNNGTVQDKESLAENVDLDQYRPEEDESFEVNFKLINVCVRSSAFKSQSLEKMFCYFLTSGIHGVDYLVLHPKYNFRLQEIFNAVSEKHEEKFIAYKASYFTAESEYNEEIYPEFRLTLTPAAVDFREQLKALEKEFRKDHFDAIRKNFYYYWRKVINLFLTKVIFSNGIEPQTLYKNIINFYDFVGDNWSKKKDEKYFKLNEFYQKFLTTYHANLTLFTQNK